MLAPTGLGQNRQGHPGSPLNSAAVAKRSDQLNIIVAGWCSIHHGVDIDRVYVVFASYCQGSQNDGGQQNCEPQVRPNP